MQLDQIAKTHRAKEHAGKRQVILLTGASVGLGLAIARRLQSQQARCGYHLVLTARAESLCRFKKHNLQESDSVWIRALDVTDARQRQSLVEEIESGLGGVDVLINNAGVSYRSCVEHVTEPERLRQMNINFRSPVELIRCVLPGMRAKRAGKIINISSVGGMMAMPTMSVYSASKFALEGASEALFYEVKPWNISVTLVQPGFMRSDAFQKVPYTAMSAQAFADCDDPYHAHYRQMNGFISKVMTRVPATSESVSKKVVKVVQAKSPPLRVYGTFDAFLFSFMRSALPRKFYNWLLYRNLPQVRTWGQK